MSMKRIPVELLILATFILATGGGKIDTPLGDAYVAFALPEK